MTKEFYRFRPINRLLGEDGELNKQEIYFAHPSKLNDPLEGYRDIIWSGDKIIWTNLFRHYLYCLQHVATLLLISGDDHTLTKDDIPVFGSVEDFPTDILKDIFSKMSTQFIENSEIRNLIKNIANRKTPIRKDELEYYLSSVHMYALKIIFDVFHEERLSPESNKLPFEVDKILDKVASDEYFKAIDGVIKESDNGSNQLSLLFFAQNQTKQQLNLLTKYNAEENKNNKNVLLIDFPSMYIHSLEKVCFPEWYTACFMSQCSSSSVWGHYGSNHSGACLIFNAEVDNERSFIKLKGINGWSSTKGEIRDWLSLDLQKINYEKSQGTTDFFRSLGSLSFPTMNSMWYYNSEGERSICANHISDSETEWRTKYWEGFYKDITIKTKDWSYENEYRVILSNSLTDLSESSKRVLNYDFSSLQGMIFGINTKEEDKLELINIIEKKCREYSRNDFKFYQAYFCFEDNCIKKSELTLLKFENKM